VAHHAGAFPRVGWWLYGWRRGWDGFVPDLFARRTGRGDVTGEALLFGVAVPVRRSATGDVFQVDQASE